MTELDDHELLAEYARNESEAAFAALVARYVNLVHSAALRFTGNPHHAEEITQAVFIILARKAGSLRRGVVMSGWLYQTARLTAANFVKGEIRRQKREQETYMQSTLNEPDAAAWEQIAPLLDEAMGCLGETDRAAVVLRFFENKTAEEVGALLKLNKGAAHKRVGRALEKLRKFFANRGVTLPAMLIAGTLAANSVQAAPVGLVVTVTAATAKGAAVAASITDLVKGTMKMMTWAKLTSATAIGAALLLAGGAATVLLTDQRRIVEFEAAGFISRVTPSGESSLWGEFSAAVSGEKSIISFRFFNGESFVCGTDGRDSYRLNEMLPARLKDPSNPQFGTISEGPFPEKALSAEQLIWLAYASSPFRITKDFKLPMESFQEIGSYATSETTMLKKTPHLPSHIQWWSPNFLIVEKTNRAYLVAYPEGYFAAELTAISETNFMGMSLPLRFSFTMFAPKSYVSTSSLEIAKYMREKSAATRRRDDVLPVETLVCTLTNLTAMTYKGDFLPTLGENVLIDDWRFERELGHGIHLPDKKFMNKGGVLVDVTPKKKWPMRDDPELIKRVRTELEAKEGAAPGR